jgi:hypothetical protein
MNIEADRRQTSPSPGHKPLSPVDPNTSATQVKMVLVLVGVVTVVWVGVLIYLGRELISRAWG